MKNLKFYIQNLNKKPLYFFYALSYFSWMIGFSSNKYDFENGYNFFFTFFSIIPIIFSGIIMMLRLVYQLEGPPRSPFHLLKYSFYLMILILSSAPFLFLWAMRDVISHLKWQIYSFKINCKNEPNLFGSFLFNLYLCAIIKKP